MDDHDFDPASGAGTDDQMLDDRLIAELRRVVGAIDPVPDGVLVAARAAIATRDLDGELAEVIDDVIADTIADTIADVIADIVADSGTWASAGPVRGGTPRRLLSFACGEVQIDLEVTVGPDRLVGIIGQVSGGSTGDCALEYPAGRQPVSLDRLGRFAITGARGGPVRVRCRSAAGERVTTSWVTL
jgi:hypothetical protein